MPISLKLKFLVSPFLPILFHLPVLASTQEKIQKQPKWIRSHSYSNLQDLEKQLLSTSTTQTYRKLQRCSLRPLLQAALISLATIALMFGGVELGLKANTVARQAGELVEESRALVEKWHNITDSLPNRPDNPDRPGWWPDRPGECSPTTRLLVVQINKEVQQSCLKKVPPKDSHLCQQATTLVQHLTSTCHTPQPIDTPQSATNRPTNRTTQPEHYILHRNP